jgi:hypothetical protein
MSNYFMNQNQKIQNRMNFRLVKETDNDAVERKIAQLQSMNDKRNRAFKLKQFSPISIKRNPVQSLWNNPQVNSIAVLSTNQEVSELLRMAKILAFKTREAFGVGEKYNLEIEKFSREYSAKISQYNLYTKIGEIFNNFRNPNYSESMFDKNYLGANISSEYMKSLQDKVSAEKKLKIAVDTVGAASGFVEPLGAKDMVGGRYKSYDDLTPDSKIARHNGLIAQYQTEAQVLENKLNKLEVTRREYEDSLDGTPGKASALEEITGRMEKISAERDKIIANIEEQYRLINELKFEKTTLKAAKAAKRIAEAEADAEAEKRRKADVEEKRKADAERRRQEAKAVVSPQKRNRDKVNEVARLNGDIFSIRNGIKIYGDDYDTQQTKIRAFEKTINELEQKNLITPLTATENQRIATLRSYIVKAEEEKAKIKVAIEEQRARMDDMSAKKAALELELGPRK